MQIKNITYEVIGLKKKIALVLSLVMFVVMLLPVKLFAAGDDKGLENAIKTAKTHFAIPEDFSFNYSVGTNNNKTVWYLSWNSKDYAKGSINAGIDEAGTIMSYDKYIPYEYPRQKKLPKISREEAKTMAWEFIEKIAPDMTKQLKYREEEGNTLVEYGYYLNYTRIVNEVPCYNNNINIRIDSDTGEVMGYYRNWSDDIEFPEMSGIISLDEAEKAYEEKLGLRLVYKYSIEDEKIKAYAAYTPKYNNHSYAIDAFTGEKIKPEPYYGYGPYFAEDAAMEKSAMQAAGGGFAREPELTPEELEAVKEVSKLIDVKKAEEIARSLEPLELADRFKLSHYSLSKSWPDKKSFTWHLSFEKEATAKDKEYGYASVSIDAKTEEIMSFYRSTPYNEKDIAKYDFEASKATVESFLKEFKKDKFNELEYDDGEEDSYVPLATEESPKRYYFRYTRMVNGTPFPGNGISVDFDAVNGKITSFNMSWYDMEFPPVDKVVSLDDIYKELYSQVGLELQYRFQPYYRPLLENDESTKKAQLVYCLTQGKPYDFDADTGVLLDYNGKPYKEIKPVEYTDISGHFAEEKIKILKEFGVALEGTEFKPDEKIIQKDFFVLLSKVISNYYGPVITSKSTGKDIDNMYDILAREGIIKEGEKSPDSFVKREDSVKYVVRALKYDKVADIEGIYKPMFDDWESISPGLSGYVAIAGGLKIVNGDNGLFHPQRELTRAEAAVIIYNYLQE